MTINRFTRWALLCGAITGSHIFNTMGATTTVLVGSGGLTFSPATANISLHDSVTWSWVGSGHTTTSGTTSGSTATPSGLWDSGPGTSNAGHTFTITFNTAGSFPYYCSVPLHYENGMKGTIVVTAPNTAPTVTLTNPPTGTTLSAPASLTLMANAADSDGTVSSVQFFQGTTSLGTVTTPPYSLAVINLAAADYAFTAIATDNGGLTATNVITVHVITASPVTASASATVSKTNFVFTYNANIGLRYIVQRTTNLAATDWVTLSTNTAASTPVSYTDTNPVPSGSYYRVGRLPNP